LPAPDEHFLLVERYAKARAPRQAAAFAAKLAVPTVGFRVWRPDPMAYLFGRIR
jgi:hypothetical protein